MILTIIFAVVLVILTLLIFVPLISHLLAYEEDAKYGGIYTVESRYFSVKYLLFLLILKIRKFKNRCEKNKLFDIEEKRYHKSIENPHSVDEEDAIDSVYFFCTGQLLCTKTNSKTSIDLILRMARRKDRISEFWIAMKQNQGPTLVHPTSPETTISNCSESGWKSVNGLSIYCDRPNEKWTIKYHGWLKEDTDEGKPVHVNIKLCFRSFTNIVDSHKDASDELSADAIARERWNRLFFEELKKFSEDKQTHYEQWGSYSGTITLDRMNEYVLEHTKGYRDHSFGIRNWHQYQRYGALFGHFENGASLSLGSVCCRRTLTHIRYGYYITPFGEMRPITSHNFNLWQVFLSSPPRSKLTIEFFAGEMFKLEVIQSSETTFDVNSGKCIIIERFVDCELNGIHGKGVNEFCSSDAVPRYKQPKISSIGFLDRNHKSSSNDFCLSLENEDCRDRNQSGGKGCQLADLVKLRYNYGEINIPKGFVITIRAYLEFVNANTEIQKHITSLVGAIKNSKAEDIKSRCHDISLAIENGSIPEHIKENIIIYLDNLFETDLDNLKLAIRSSTADEDSSGSSSAGQMATFLNVNGSENIIQMIKGCWASQFTHTAVSYRVRNGQPVNSSMAVVIMEMVQSYTSGVLFTCNPVSGDSTRMLLHATFGLGEAIVSGKYDPDQIEIEKASDDTLQIVSKLKGTKELTNIRPDDDHVLEKVGVSQEDICLSDHDILQLAHIGALIEKCYGEPCDIEWAIKDDQIFLLQTRPITSLNIETDQELIQEFDSGLSYDGECLTTSNIGEMMPMATTPLTLSLFASAVDRSFQMMLIKVGIISRLLYPRRFLPSFSNHLYINIHISALLSDINNLSTLFIAILGRVLEKPSKDDILRFTGTPSFFSRIYIRILQFWKMKSDRENTKKWEKRFQCGYKVRSKFTSRQQMDVILSQIKDYYMCWYDTIQNTSNSALWTIVLMKVMENKKGWNNEVYTKVATLLSTCSNVLSADIPTALKTIAISIRQDEESRKFILTETDESCLAWLNSAKSKNVGILFQEFLARHGHRCIREAEFQETSWRRSPEKLVSVIKAMATHLSEDDYHIKANLSIDEAIDNLHLNLNFLKKKIVKWVLDKARKGVSSREWGKSISIQMCDAFKQSFSKLAELMVEENIIPQPDLIYYFTFDELISVILDGDQQISSILGKVHRRWRVFENQMKASMPEICFGTPYGTSDSGSHSQSQMNGHIKLSGLPVSIGRVSGQCRVISTLEEASNIKPGEILIVPYTDVGWTPYFPLLGGLVTEKGSLLSHGAVVAREYGLPCLVGCAGATKVFQTGDRVLLNASEGSVEVCNT